MRSREIAGVSQLGYYSPQLNFANTLKNVNESQLAELTAYNSFNRSIRKKEKPKRTYQSWALGKNLKLRFGYNYSEIRSGKLDVAASNEY